MRMFVGAMLAVALLGLAATARADEEKVAIDKLPKAVSDTVKKRFPKAELVEAVKETVDGKTEYEVSTKEAGKKAVVTVAADGTLTLIEKEIAAKDFPKAVTDAIEAKYPKSKITLAEEVIKVKAGKEKLDMYEATVETADKKTIELEIALDGKIKKSIDKTPKPK